MQPMIASDATAQRAAPCHLDHPQLQPAGRAIRLCREPAARHRRLVNTELHGALAGGLNGASSLRSRFWCCGGAYGASLHQLPFLPYLARRSLLYLGIILLVLIASNLRVGITRADIAFSLAMSLGFNLLLGVNDLLGPGVLFAFVAGRYYHPRREERILLFIDMRASTAIAERLGEEGFWTSSTDSPPICR